MNPVIPTSRSIRILVVFISVLACGCSKTDPVQPGIDIVTQNSELLIGRWRLVAMTSDRAYDWDGNGTKEVDYFSAVSACDKDREITFNIQKTGTYQFKCNDTKSFNWALTQQGKAIDFFFAGVGFMSQWIVSLSSTTLVLTVTMNTPESTQALMEMTFRKQ